MDGWILRCLIDLGVSEEGQDLFQGSAQTFTDGNDSQGKDCALKHLQHEKYFCQSFPAPKFNLTFEMMLNEFKYIRSGCIPESFIHSWEMAPYLNFPNTLLVPDLVSRLPPCLLESALDKNQTFENIYSSSAVFQSLQGSGPFPPSVYTLLMSLGGCFLRRTFSKSVCFKAADLRRLTRFDPPDFMCAWSITRQRSCLHFCSAATSLFLFLCFSTHLSLPHSSYKTYLPFPPLLLPGV